VSGRRREWREGEMNSEDFERLLGRLADQPFPVTELVGAAGGLQASGENERAVLLYRMWVRCNATDPLRYVALFNLGTLLSTRGELEAAKTAFEQAIEANADFYPAYINLGNVLERLGRAGEAINQWNTITQRLGSITASNISHKATAYKQIGRVLESNLQHAAAEGVLQQGMSLDPEQVDVAQHYVSLRMIQCKWPVVEPWEGVTRKDLLRGISPLSLGAYTDDPIYQLAAAWNYNRTITDPPAGTEYLWKQAKRQPSRRLRIGYLSSDLREHAIGFLMSELVELHDREKVEVFAYYCGIKTEDPTKARISAAVEHWVDITQMDDLAAAQRIAADNIDILVDVNGYTRDARTKVLTYRPAPVIVNWLGFPGSMGSPYHHYIIADEWIIPKDFEIYYTEKVMRLPCYQPTDRKRVIAPERPTRQEMGLPEDAVVFCCFNGSHKFSRFTYERWLRILQGVPGSVLWLLGSAEEVVHERLKAYAAARGVDATRIIFAGKMPNPKHLARYPLADLFLDTFPYGAHTTASDALWMGVPVLTFSGRGFASRVCGSLTRAAGLPELVVETPDAFVARAIALGNDRAALKAYRDKLAATRDTSVLFDMDGLTRSLEGLYRDMWQDFEKGTLPRVDLANLDIYREMAIEEDHEAQEMLSIDDFNGFYQRKLALRHKFRPVPEDKRLWTAKAIKAAEKA
jgi:predicted O-linked N-acetylglucosamine transferase (SPINDLY family)